MKASKKLAIYLINILIIALAVSGCGKESGAKAPVGTAAPAVVETVPTAEPAPAPTLEPTPTPVPTANPDIPVISIAEGTMPGNMEQGGVVNIRGVVKTSVGQLVSLWAKLSDDGGSVLQNYSYVPYSPEFSLAGTVNANMTFGTLLPGNYEYELGAIAENGQFRTETVIVRQKFTIYAPGEMAAANLNSSQWNTVEIDTQSPESAGPFSGEWELGYIPSQLSEDRKYVVKNTYDSENSGVMWNYFINYFANPYAAAVMLAHIDMESDCDPCRVESDPTGEHYFSSDYTALVDEGSVSRDSFVNELPRKDCGHGYGLLQWTGEDKGAIYDLAKEYECSVGDIGLQCDYIILEMQQHFPWLHEGFFSIENINAAMEALNSAYDLGDSLRSRTNLAIRYLNKYALE